MAGDLTEIEICDICGKETSEFSTIDGLIVCESCKENFELKESEDNSSHVCAVCGWPIQRVISKKETKIFIRGIKKWLSEIKIREKEKINEFLDNLAKHEHYVCRYDFFYLVKDYLENFDKNVAKDFEKEIASQYDFLGSLIS